MRRHAVAKQRIRHGESVCRQLTVRYAFRFIKRHRTHGRMLLAWRRTPSKHQADGELACQQHTFVPLELT